VSEMEKAGVLEEVEFHGDHGNILLSPEDVKDKSNGDLLQHEIREAFQVAPN